ncbi:3-oxoacyl-ACP synthase III family protein [Sphingobacterium luzhongxinii]|uniref:3-oxoacyl-ACP synthase III family protein n=1 Tax=Sphingobacterium luzhongxinii TaxID=2654181 RepID=UPI0013DBB937|nr:ketoacyl-ACP synthase III [Sphingobacterium sp. xlx-73]
MGAVLKAIEYVFPSKEVSNSDLSKVYPEYDFEKFEQKVGIKSRYWVEDNETALDLAERACLKLFERYDKASIDYIIYCTQSPEYFLPTTACILQERLGLSTHIGAYDFNLGCSGYVYGLSMAYALINSNQAKNILLVTAETYSKFLHRQDKSNRAIFGDAATASLISEDEFDGFGKFGFGTDGSGADKLIVKNGGAKNALEENAVLKEYGTDNAYTDNHLYMNGPEVFNFTTKRIPGFTKEVLEKNQLSIAAVDQFVFHQANSFMLEFLRKRIGVESSNFYNNLADGGNTVSNTIPIGLKRFSNDIKIDDPKTIVIVGFGVGLSWAGGAIKIKNSL